VGASGTDSVDKRLPLASPHAACSQIASASTSAGSPRPLARRRATPH
jgi:hypothetical protein